MYTWFEEDLLMTSASNPSLHSFINNITQPCINSRFEMLGPLGHNYFKDQVDSINSLFGDFYLISDNFNTSLFGGINGSDIRRNNINKLAIPDDEKSLLLNKLVESEKLQLQSAHSFAHLVNDIVARYPQKRFIFRPHPVSRCILV